MSQPLVIAYHLVWTAYGWWLPNDPRGNGSRTIRNDPITELGAIHYGRKQVQPAGHVVKEFYEKVATVLRHPLLTFDEPARAEIATAFADVIAAERYTCFACAIMPDHVHILIRKHKHQAEQMFENFKNQSRLRLSAHGFREPDHPTWTAGVGWKVFLDHPDEIRRTIPYIQKNALALKLPVQHWPFIKPYDGWPLHPGHNPHSPYCRRLREAGRLQSQTS